MKLDVAHVLLRAASRLISTLALLYPISTLVAQTASSNWIAVDVAYIIRIADANQRFTSSIPGWKTDRGRIYGADVVFDFVDHTTQGIPSDRRPNG
jgi:hypothetical protein